MYKAQEKFMANPTQMYRVDGRGKILEVMMPNYDFQKVTINIIEYNQNNVKTGQVSHYFSVPWFLEFCRKVQSNTLYQAVEAQRAAAAGGADTKNLPPIVRLQAGSEDKRTGEITAREFTVELSTKSGVLFKITSGPGYKTKEGLTPLDYKRVNEFKRTLIPISYQQLYEMAAICDARIKAWIFWMQMTGAYDYKPENTRAQQGASPLPSPVQAQPDYQGYQTQQAAPVAAPVQEASSPSQIQPMSDEEANYYQQSFIPQQAPEFTPATMAEFDDLPWR